MTVTLNSMSIAQLLSFVNHTNHVWLPVIVTFIGLKLIFHQPFRQRRGILLGRLAILSVIVYLCILGLLWVRQSRLLYKPTHVLQTTPESHNLKYEEVWIPANDETSERLHSWWIPQRKNRIGALIYFHGAGLNIGYNVTQAHWLRKLGLDVLLAEYRGYGLSEGGFPTEKSFYEDAEAALDYLTQEQGISESEILVYGHSLGGAIAIDLATKHPDLAGIIVQNSFTTMADMVARTSYARWFPVRAMLHQRFESINKVRRLQMPILLIHTTGDPMIPCQMSERLYEAARDPKELILVKSNVHHNAGAEFRTPEHLAKIKSFAIKSLSATSGVADPPAHLSSLSPQSLLIPFLRSKLFLGQTLHNS